MFVVQGSPKTGTRHIVGSNYFISYTKHVFCLKLVSRSTDPGRSLDLSLCYDFVLEISNNILL